MKQRIIIWGASGHARVVADILRLQQKHEIVGFLDDVNKLRCGDEFCHAQILGGKEKLDDLYEHGVHTLIVAFGNCKARVEAADYAMAKGFSLATAIHPSAVISQEATIGSGTVIAAGVVVNPATLIGQNVILNTCASVDHDCTVHDGVHVCPGVHIAGDVTVGKYTWIGIGATVVDHIRIGSGTLVGAGAVVLGDLPDEIVAYGIPARVIRKNISWEGRL